MTSSLSPKPQHIYGILLVNHFLYFFALTVHDYLMQVRHVANTSECTGFHFVLSVRVINDVCTLLLSRLSEQQLDTCIDYVCAADYIHSKK